LSNGTARVLNINPSGGNVGINTTTPAARLDVAGDLRTYNGITSRGEHSYTFIENILPAVNNGATTGDVQLRMWCSEPGVTWDWAGFGYNVRNDNGAPGGFGRVNTAFGQAYMRFATTGDWYFYNTNTSGTRTTTMTLSSGGNVGIGTTAPSYKLQVYSGAASANTIAFQVSDSANGISYVPYVSSGGYNTASVNGGSALFNTAGSDWWVGNQNGSALRFSGNTSLLFYANSTAQGIWNSTGLGVGTTSPASMLHISGTGNTFTRYTNTTNSGQLIDVGSNSSGQHFIFGYGAYPMLFGTNGSEVLRITAAGNVGIGTASPSAKLHVIGNVTVSATLLTAGLKLTGTLADSFNQVGTAGQVLSSTGTGVEWITGGGGGGGSTIAVKDDGVSIGSSFTTLDFIGNNIQATASGSTASITAFNNAGTGSYYLNAATTNYAPGATFGDVEIDSGIIFAASPDAATGSSKLIATVTFGVENVSTNDNFNNFEFRLYDVSQSIVVSNTTHIWTGYMSKNEGATRTVFTFHIPLDTDVTPGDQINVQAKQGVSYTPEIYFCAITLLEGTT
jgi:hypothetical protein